MQSRGARELWSSHRTGESFGTAGNTWCIRLAVTLAYDREPDKPSKWENERYARRLPLWELLRRALKTREIPVKDYDKDEGDLFKPLDFVKWLDQCGYEIPQPMRDCFLGDPRDKAT